MWIDVGAMADGGERSRTVLCEGDETRFGNAACGLAEQEHCCREQVVLEIYVRAFGGTGELCRVFP